MTGFILWMHEQLGAYRAAHGLGRWEPLSPSDHAAFDAMIGARDNSPDGIVEITAVAA